MKRFFGDEQPDKEYYFEDEEEEIIDFLDKNDIINIVNIDLAQIELNQKLLEKAIQIAEKTIFWRFKSEEKKLASIGRIYSSLYTLTEEESVDEDEEEEEEEE